jgi:PAS domain S-box-containing protein
VPVVDDGEPAAPTSGEQDSRATPRLEDLDFSVLELVSIPLGVHDSAGRLVWLNSAGEDATGFRRTAVGGRSCFEFLSENLRDRAMEIFARTVERMEPADFETAFTRSNGSLAHARIRLAPLRDGDAVIGVIASAWEVRYEESTHRRPPDSPKLTPRQHEILRLLAGAMSTDEIAGTLSLSSETVRNHIRAILRTFDAHSRLEAVINAERCGLLPPSPLGG